jgi:hypothetical protein
VDTTEQLIDGTQLGGKVLPSMFSVVCFLEMKSRLDRVSGADNWGLDHTLSPWRVPSFSYDTSWEAIYLTISGLALSIANEGHHTERQAKELIS